MSARPFDLAGAAALAAILLGACAGDIAGGMRPDEETGPGGAPAVTPPAPAEPAAPGPGAAPATPRAATLPPPAMRRLTVSQIQNSLRDLVGAAPSAAALEPDPVDEEHFTFASAHVAHVTTSAAGVAGYDAAVRALLAPIFADATRRRALAGCEPTLAAADACVSQFLAGFGRRAWRRPLTAEEIARYQMGLAQRAPALGDPWKGLELVTAALLTSPNFLYRFELGEPDPARPGRRRLTDHELAARLSYLLWNTTPDQALLDAANRGELRTDAGLRAQLDRLLASSRARAAIVGFLTEWLGARNLDRLAKDRNTYGTFDSALGSAMQQDAERRLADLALDRDGDFLAGLYEGREAFVNAALARLYGLPPEAAPASGYARVTFPADGPRVGYLTSAAFLAANARATMTSPTLRGIAIRERLLCQVVPPPPPNIDASFPPPVRGRVETTRQRLERHRTDPACAGCHQLVDPLGVALEHFDGIGAFRTTEAGQPIDASGALDGKPYTDARGLAALLRTDERVTACAVTQLYRHALGRHEEHPDEAGLAQLAAAWSAGGRRFRPLLAQLVLSEGFRHVEEVK